MGFPGGSDSKESACNVEDLGLIPGLERSSRERMAIHSSILAWRIPGTGTDMTEQLTHTHKLVWKTQVMYLHRIPSNIHLNMQV